MTNFPEVVWKEILNSTLTVTSKRNQRTQMFRPVEEFVMGSISHQRYLSILCSLKVQ